MVMNTIYIIDSLGGTVEVARICGIKPPSVSEWKTNGIPWPWLMYFSQIRPDVVDPQVIEALRIEKLAA